MRTRDIGIDLLKILLAFMVLTLHFNSQPGMVLEHTTELSANWVGIWFMETLCYCAVNIYVIISGYYSFLQNKKQGDVLRKLKQLWFCLIFYSLMEYLVISIVLKSNFDFFDVIKRLLPVSNGEWWFFTLYFIIYFISPFLNRVIALSEEKELLTVLVFGIGTFCIISQLLLWNDSFGTQNGYSLIWFIFLYFTGAIIARFHNNDFNGIIYKMIGILQKKKIVILLGCICVLFGSKIGIAFLSRKIWGEVKYSGLLFSYNSIFVYLIAISLFLIFKDIKIKKGILSRIILFLSPLSLASYLFHCQTDFVEKVWPLIECHKYANEYYLILIYLVTVFAMYFCAISIEFMRIKVLKLFKKDLKRGDTSE